MKSSFNLLASGKILRAVLSTMISPNLPPRAVLALSVLVLSGVSTHAGIAYGSINNFDTVNDTGVECHGFEIELDDIRSSAITYTNDWNHYGTPKITEDTSVPGHTNVLVRYEAVWMGTKWSAYTAVPTNNIPPTQGHAFTNPSLNFGGEHFGLGYRTQPTKVYYHWLVDGGSHTLALGPQVNVSTPAFTYNPPPAQGQPAVVQAVVPAPVQPPPPPWSTFEFSDATWVKEIVTTTHTNDPVELRDLITPDTNNPAAKDWRNGQDAQVEIQWQLLQTDFLSADYNPTNGVGGKNGKLPGPNQNLGKSDDVVTTRYEFYAYTGPYDDPNGGTHQALAEIVAPDGLHGIGMATNSNGDVFDLSTNEVVGKFLGAQMSAMAAAPPIGLIDHLPDGEANVPYPSRSLVIASDTNYTASLSGTLPTGLLFDAGTSMVYGTPTETGTFIIKLTATASNNPVLKKTYPFIVGAGAILPPHSTVDSLASPLVGGATSGDGVYTNGTTATVSATPNAGYGFANWTDNGAVVSTAASYTFTNTLNRSLVANFAPKLSLSTPQPHALVIAWLTNFGGYVLQQKTNVPATNWTTAAEAVSIVGENYQATIQTTNGPRFFRLMHP